VKALLTKYSAKVVVLSRHSSSELSALESPSLLFLQRDITQVDTAKFAISETLRKFGRLDSIVLNAGTLDPVTRIKNSTVQGWKDCFNVNVFSNIPLVLSLLWTLAHGRSLKLSRICGVPRGV